MKPIVIVIPEDMSHWNCGVTMKTGKISAVFLYDSEIQVFSSELIPSYKLYFLYYLTQYAIGEYDSSKLHEDGVYQYRDGCKQYRHVRDIDCKSLNKIKFKYEYKEDYSYLKNFSQAIDECSMMNFLNEQV